MKMRTKNFFIAALGFALALSACTKNLEPSPIINGEVKGAVLVGTDLSMNISRGSQDTKLTTDENGRVVWESGDQVGVAWFNTASAITLPQLKIVGTNTDGLAAFTDFATYTWPALKEQADAATAIVDNKIYANHLFVYSELAETFVSLGDVYEGVYFAYYPFQRLSDAAGIVPMDIITPFTVSSTNAKEEYLGNVASLSANNRILAAETEEGVINRDFELNPIMNALVIKPKTVNKGEFTDEALNKITIQSVEINNTVVDFRATADLLPYNIPSAVYSNKANKTATNALYDAAKTKANFYKGVTATTPANTSIFALDGAADEDKHALILSGASKDLITLMDLPEPLSIITNLQEKDGAADTESGLTMFTFPTLTNAVVAKENVSITINANCGTYTIQYVVNPEAGSAEEANNKTIEKLAALLDKDGWKSGSNTYKLSEVVPSRIALPISLDMTKFVFSTNFVINNIQDWDYACAVVNAFDWYKNQDVIFTLGDDITITDKQVPPFALRVQGGAGPEKLILTGEKVAFHENSYIHNLVVDQDGYLTLDGKSYIRNLVVYGTAEVEGNVTMLEQIYNTYENWRNLNKPVGISDMTLDIENEDALKSMFIIAPDSKFTVPADYVHAGLNFVSTDFNNNGRFDVLANVTFGVEASFYNNGTTAKAAVLSINTGKVLTNNGYMFLSAVSNVSTPTAASVITNNSEIELAAPKDVFLVAGKANATSLVTNAAVTGYCYTTLSGAVADHTTKAFPKIEEINQVVLTGDWNVTKLDKVAFDGETTNNVAYLYLSSANIDLKPAAGKTLKLTEIAGVSVAGTSSLINSDASLNAVAQEFTLSNTDRLPVIIAKNANFTIGKNVKFGITNPASINGLINLHMLTGATLTNEGSLALHNGSVNSKNSTIMNKHNLIICTKDAANVFTNNIDFHNNGIINTIDGTFFVKSVINDIFEAKFHGLTKGTVPTVADHYNK